MKMQVMRIFFVCALVGVGGALMWQYEHKWSVDAKRAEEVRKLKEQNEQLEKFVERLTSEKRVAEVVVSDQKKTGSVVEETTLMFLEYVGDAKQVHPRFFTIKGNVAHIDSMVIKFESDFVKAGDPLRGHSLVLFHRLYGDYQAPVEGFMIDEPGRPPEVYRSATSSPEASAFEYELWGNFWKLADDEAYRKEKGVRVAMGESPWTRFYPDKIYTLTLQADGGLSLSSRVMDGVWREYREALLKAKGAVTQGR